MADLFTPDSQHGACEPQVEDMGDGIFLIKQFAPSEQCLNLIRQVSQAAPFRQMMTPMGYPTQASMSNCGDFGWVSDLSGYRYSPVDPITQKPWPAMPDAFLRVHQSACELLDLPKFQPDACLINRYEIGHAMGRHTDKDEQDTSWPIVSVSLGLPAVFQVFKGQTSTASINVLLEDGDVLILSGVSRQQHHAIKAVKPDLLQPNLTTRYNLTLRHSH